MPTAWFYPNTVSQYYEVTAHVPWNNVGNFFSIKHPDGGSLSLSAPLLHIANPTVNDLKMKTYFLALSEFNVIDLPETISGIEVEINMNRQGRITDDTIQLRYNNQFVGENKANFNLDPNKTYGSNTDLWGASWDYSTITDPSFGIGVRFQSHPSWPHNAYPKIDYIRVRVH